MKQPKKDKDIEPFTGMGLAGYAMMREFLINLVQAGQSELAFIVIDRSREYLKPLRGSTHARKAMALVEEFEEKLKLLASKPSGVAH